ncbi:MAG: helix-turn-helix transcriptional regulator [Chloroflexi bacterium]|nr:helix-turn-helix transcriptional regulator [Chloroflexota bacterium]
MINQTALQLRTRIIGVLLRNARQAAGKSIKQCADLLGITPAAYRKCETGQQTLALPQLEVLAHAFRIPLDHFWNDDLLPAGTDQPPAPTDQLILLRQRIIGARLRHAREQANLSLKELAEQLGVTASRLSNYELGKRPIPLPELESLAAALNLSVDDFREDSGPAARWQNERRLAERMQALPEDLRRFIAQPVNESYLRLAMELSQMPVTRLRSIAEGLLDITL